MEKTSMYYGFYHNRTFGDSQDPYKYNMGLAYMLSIIIVFIVSFLVILAK